MNKTITFASTQSRFFTVGCLPDLANEIEFKTGAHKQMLPCLQLLASKGTKMKISFFLFSVFIFRLSAIPNIIVGCGEWCFYSKKSSLFSQNLCRWKNIYPAYLWLLFFYWQIGLFRRTARAAPGPSPEMTIIPIMLRAAKNFVSHQPEILQEH